MDWFWKITNKITNNEPSQLHTGPATDKRQDVHPENVKMKSSRTLCKDFFKFQREIKSLSDGQARILECVGDKCEEFVMEIAPYDGHYKGGKFKFRVDVSQGHWPKDPPIVICQTDIYHPNIDTEYDYILEDVASNICVNLLDIDWCRDFSFDVCLQGILFLFYEPNFGEPLSPLCRDDTNFEEFVKISIEGGDVKGRVFKTNYGWAENMVAKTRLEVNEIKATEQIITDDTKDNSKVGILNSDTNSAISDPDGRQKNELFSIIFREDLTEIKGCKDDENENASKDIKGSGPDSKTGLTALTDDSIENENDHLTERADSNVVEHREDSNLNNERSSKLEEQASPEMFQIESTSSGENNVAIPIADTECSMLSSKSELSIKLIEEVNKSHLDIMVESKNGNLADISKTSAENLSLQVDIKNHDITRFKNRHTRKFRFLETMNMVFLISMFKSLWNWMKGSMTLR